MVIKLPSFGLILNVSSHQTQEIKTVLLSLEISFKCPIEKCLPAIQM